MALQKPLPLLTFMNEWFWTSGQDGTLRIDGCDDCGQLVHPPQPICPKCRSKARSPKAVSGAATVVGFTVNHQPWHPAFPPPYVIANVVLAEDSSVHLTTNIINCDPADVQIGSEVQVKFEQVEDVWLPLFELTGAIDPVDRVVEPRANIRPPATAERFEHKVVLSGVGRSAIGRRLMRDPLSLTVDACLEAVADAGLTLDDIDGLSTYPGGVGYEIGFTEGGVSAVEEALRLNPTWINGGSDLPGQGGAIIAAMMAVASGMCRHVLCFRTVWQATAATMKFGGGSGRLVGDMAWRMPYGLISAASGIGMNATQYMHRYGADRRMLGWIALNGRANAGRNPAAIYRDPMTMDDYMSARLVSTPFGLYDCDVPCDASVAVIVSAVDVAGDLPRHGIRVEAVGTQISERISWDQGTVTHEPQVFGPAAHMWSRTEMRHKDVDLALLYDGFTFNAISWLESLGFCGLGEAQDWLDGGKRIAMDGELPLNPHGGQLSEGRTHGFGYVYEAVKQLRGEADARQVADAKVAVVSTGGVTPGGALLLRRGDL